MRPASRMGLVAITALAPLLVANGSRAQTRRPQPTERPRPEIVESWIERLDEAHRLLVEEKYKKGLRTVERVLDSITGRVQSGEIDTLLAGAVALRAVAQAGLGNMDDALWDWSTAEALDPAVAGSELAVYGETGERLDRERQLAEQRPSLVLTGAMEPPEKVRAPQVSYPAGLLSACAEGLAFVGVTVESDGRPTRPWLTGSGTRALMAFAALETVRNWRFRPALENGNPVPVSFTLVVQFEMPSCDLFPTEKSRAKDHEGLIELPAPASRELPVSIAIDRVDPSPEQELTSPKMIRIKAGYRVPRDLLASGTVLLLPQFERRDGKGTFVVQEPHARVQITRPEGSTTIYCELDHVWKSKLLAKPIHLWLYAVAVDQEGQMEVVGVAGPVSYPRK